MTASCSCRRAQPITALPIAPQIEVPQLAQRAVDGGLLESLPVQWESEIKPQLERELRT